jgi:hypothetical protein
MPTVSEEGEKKKLEEEKKPLGFFAESHSNGGVLPGLAVSSSCDIAGADLYVGAHYQGEGENYVSAYGPPPDPSVCPPPAVAPSIGEQFVTRVDPGGASVRARINPHFWPDVSFYVEYGTGVCSTGGCGERQPVAGETLFGSRVVNASLLSPVVNLSGLSESTTYHFRVIAKSGGGGPVVSKEGTFTTPAARQPLGDGCPNSAFRSGAGAFLADCRAYEMVTPVDKNGGDVYSLFAEKNYHAEVDQSASGGGKFGYSSYRAFGDAQSAPYVSQYIATRDPRSGWSSEGISPPRGQGLLTNIGLDTEYQAFSPDLCRSWLLHDSDPPLATGAVAGFANLYGRDDCGVSPSYEAITRAQPECQTASSYAPEVQGVAAEGQAVVVRVNDRLTENAGPCGLGGENDKYQCYFWSAGKLHLLSVLPDGEASTLECSLGTAFDRPASLRYASVANALSDDGLRAFWTAHGAGEEGPGNLFLRRNPGKAQSALAGEECTEPIKACTIVVSGTVSNAGATFWGASGDGSRALFSFGDNESLSGSLYEARIVEQAGKLVAEPTLVAGEFGGILGMSSDASSVYLVSGEALDGGATAGTPNLYLYRRAEVKPFRFIATLATSDIKQRKGSVGAISFPSLVNPVPAGHVGRVSSDGKFAVFMSGGSLTGFDNRDVETGEPDDEVYYYDAVGAGALHCVSCAASNARPVGRELLLKNSRTLVRAAGQIPDWPTDLYASRVLSEDGSRVFFESYGPLVVGDTNEKQDVYEWEAVDAGSCSTASPAYSAPNGGCVSLVSSGESSQDSQFIDASGDGGDVFFTTGQSLLAKDPGLIDIYDARADGGFPEPAPPAAACQGETCQGTVSPPIEQTPTSWTFVGPGNPQPQAAAARTVKKKAPVKRKQRRKKKRRGKGRRAVHNRVHGNRNGGK